jgi:squalene cyclase
MEQRRKYRKRTLVAAVQLNLDTPGFTYEKWGGTQRCSPGDWVVSSDGDTYTVQRDSFAQTYKQVDVGKYRKATPIWATVATEAGQVQTKEGLTSYQPGDYLVSNDAEGHDQYAISKDRFNEMYEPTDD